MKKKHVFRAIAFFIVGLVYGAIFNYILRGENTSVLSCYVQGLFVGMLSSVMYFLLFLFFGYCFDEEYLNDALSKVCIISENIVATVGIMYGTTMFVNWNNEYPITIDYAWMHIVNLFFAVVVVAKANYDGKVLRIKRKK